MKNVERITFLVDTEKKEVLKKEARKLNLTLSGLVKVAVAEYIENHSK